VPQPAFRRHFATLLGGNGAAFALQLTAAPVLTRLFTPADFGVYANAMALAGLLGVVGAGRYEQAIVRSGAEAHALARMTLRMTAVSTLVACAVCAAAQVPLMRIGGLPPGLAVLGVPLLGGALLAHGILVQLANSQGDSRRMALAKSGYAAATAGAGIALGLVGLSTSPYSGYALPAAALFGFVAVTPVLLPVLRTPRGEAAEAVAPRDLRRQHRDFPRWNLPLALVDILNQQVLFNAVFTGVFGAGAMGLYGVTWRYLRAPAGVVTASASALFYREAAASPGGVLPHFYAALRHVAVFAVPLTAALMLGGPWLFGTVLGAGWEEAGRYAAVLAPAIGLGMLSGAVSSLPMAVGRQRAFTAASVAGSTAALAGLAGAGAAGLGAEVALGVYSGLLCVQYGALLVWFRNLALPKSAPR
jgi:O-antigen/teichoic acid export membrane protein